MNVVNFPSKVDEAEEYHMEKDEALESIAEESGNYDAMVFIGLRADGDVQVSKFVRNTDDVLRLMGAIEILKMTMVNPNE